MPKRVLIVDDDKRCVMLMKQQLESHGYEVSEVFSGSEVFSRLFREEFDLVILDYFMPDVKGSTVCQTIRSEPRFQNLPILIVTAHPMDEGLFREYGVSDVVYKPCDSETLVKKVRACIGEA